MQHVHFTDNLADLTVAQACAAAKEAGVVIPMVSTAITDTDSPHAEAIFAAGAHYSSSSWLAGRAAAPCRSRGAGSP